jgi:hypothetical protein
MPVNNILPLQVYRGMDIGSNKPTPAERAAVRYHLLDVCDPDVHEYTAADFAVQVISLRRLVNTSLLCSPLCLSQKTFASPRISSAKAWHVTLQSGTGSGGHRGDRGSRSAPHRRWRDRLLLTGLLPPRPLRFMKRGVRSRYRSSQQAPGPASTG